MNELPLNIFVDKPKKPKRWAYILKTSEVLDGLELSSSTAKFNINYDNSPPPKFGLDNELEKSFNVLGVGWYGAGEEPFFSISISVCKPEYRKKLVPILQTEVFPVIRRWIKNIQAKPSAHTIRLGYHDYRLSLVLTENYETVLWETNLNLSGEE